MNSPLSHNWQMMDSASLLKSLLSDAAQNHFSLAHGKIGHQLRKGGQYKCLLPMPTVSIFSRDICKGQEPAKRMRSFAGENILSVLKEILLVLQP